MRPVRSTSRTVWLVAGLAIVVILAALVPGLTRRLGVGAGGDGYMTIESPPIRPVSFQQQEALNLNGGVGWINSGPISLDELRGKIVLLDFWTFCCINCHHVLPDLAKLEEKYGDELVVIGVHTAKFAAEQDTENIRRKVREYRIKHPVVNDANQEIWRRFGVNSWPTLVLIDPAGHFVGSLSGEGHYEQLDRVIGRLVAIHKERGDLNTTPLKFSPEMDRPSDGPLLFPGKVFADAARQAAVHLRHRP